MEKKLNENLVSMMGKAFLDKSLKFGEDVTLIVKGNVLKVEREDNQDGTFDMLHKVKLITVDIADDIAK